MAAQTYFSTNGVQGFPFLHILTNICYLCSFWWQPFWQVWGDISLRFCFAFPWWLARLSIFSWLSAFPLWKNVYSVFLPVGFFFLSCMSCLYILHINPLLVISFANIFSHLVGHLFIDGFQQILSLVRSRLFLLFFLLTLGGRSKKYSCNLCQRVLCLYFPPGIFYYGTWSYT